MEIITGVAYEAYVLLNKMSVYLLFGFLFAGVLHIFMKEGVIAKHLGTKSFASVIKASMLGIPLPLCSCGVVPTALAIRKDGASKGAVLSFLISTPVTGIDSIFASYALLGWFFTLYRIFAAFFTAVVAGLACNIFGREESGEKIEGHSSICKTCSGHIAEDDHADHSHSFFERIKSVFSYAFVDLLGDTGWWILIGIMIGGIISYFIPAAFVETYLGSPIQSMLIMLVLGIPMYVCASGSLPIVAALIMKGMNPGAGFVFLLTGPATNSVALTVIAKKLGISTMIIFVGSVIVSSLLLGYAFDFVWTFLGYESLQDVLHHTQVFPAWLEVTASSVLLIAIVASFIYKKSTKHSH